VVGSSPDFLVLRHLDVLAAPRRGPVAQMVSTGTRTVASVMKLLPQQCRERSTEDIDTADGVHRNHGLGIAHPYRRGQLGG